MMYFDFYYYSKVLAFTWRNKQWPGRNKMLLQLLLWVPLKTVVNTICFMLDYVFFPKLWVQEVVKPVFIVGHARSGTTLMHRLMSADEDRFSYFLYWEMFFPALTQRKIIGFIGFLDRALLGGAIKKRLEELDEKIFSPWRHIHELSFWMPEEDQFVMNAAFLTQQWTLELPMAEGFDIFHIDNLSEKRRRKWLNFYKECVKRQLLARGSNKIHLSKNPVMSGWVNAPLDTFPDASIVVLVRDPIQCMPSILKLVESQWASKSWSPAEYRSSLLEITNISFDSFYLPDQALQKRPHTPHKIVDYRKLIVSPKAVVKEVYDALNLEFSDTYSEQLDLRQEREKKHEARFIYDIDDYETNAEEIESRLAPFYEKYQWVKTSETTEDAT